MIIQMVFIRNILFTVGAVGWFITCRYTFMIIYIALIRKTLVTMGTLEWFFACMFTFMLIHIGFFTRTLIFILVGFEMSEFLVTV